MKQAHAFMSGKKPKLDSRREKSGDFKLVNLNQPFNGFAMNRTKLIAAEDIRTFWRFSKDVDKNPLNKILTQTFF